MGSNNNISFYEVDLVCNIASSIGCGSRSKPILIELENESIIKEAKLNRKGNIIGITWYENRYNYSRLEVINSIFSRNRLLAKESNSNSYRDNLASYLNKENPWLDSANIDELSREEAGIVAKQLIAIYEAEATLTSKQESKLKEDVEDIFYDFFLNFKKMDQLSDTNMYRKLVIQVIELSKNYIHSNKIPVVNSLLIAINGHSEKNYESDCCNK